MKINTNSVFRRYRKNRISRAEAWERTRRAGRCVVDFAVCHVPQHGWRKDHQGEFWFWYAVFAANPQGPDEFVNPDGTTLRGYRLSKPSWAAMLWG